MINGRVPTNLLSSRIASDIVQQQNSLANIQEQISSGKKVNRPSDAPAQAAHLLTMRETTSRLEQYSENSSIAESQLSLEEGALAATTDALTRVRDLTLQAINGTNTSFREESNAEIKLIRDELFSLANSQDSFGNYLFSGSNGHQQPFTSGTPTSYSGSDESNRMQIALDRTIETGDSGVDVFMRIRNGNGDFKTSNEATNTGTGIISPGAVSDSSLFQGGEFSITFTSPTQYEVTEVIDETTSTVILSAQPYKSGENIELQGMTVQIGGQPDTGDVFSIAPSAYEDVFSTMTRLIDALDTTPGSTADAARNNSDINTAINQIDNALDHINTTRATVGTRLNSIDSSRDENENITLQIERVKQDVEDVDIADAVTRLQTQANSLEILQKSYARVEGLSLFNFL